MERAQVLDALSALASPTRLDLVRALIVAGDAGIPAGRIATLLGVSASRLSFHLTTLLAAGLVSARRDGRSIIYTADHRGIGGVIGYLLHDCCAGHPAVSACAAPSEGRQSAGTVNICPG